MGLTLQKRPNKVNKIKLKKMNQVIQESSWKQTKILPKESCYQSASFRSALPEQPRQRNMNYLVPVCLTNGCVERHLPCSEPFKGIITDNKRHVFKRELIEKNLEQKKSETVMTPLTGIAIYFFKNSIQ